MKQATATEIAASFRRRLDGMRGDFSAAADEGFLRITGSGECSHDPMVSPFISKSPFHNASTAAREILLDRVAHGELPADSADADFDVAA